MALKCNNTTKLLDFIKATYLGVTVSTPTATQIKIDFTDGLVVNIYPTTGTVNFMGKNAGNQNVSHITNQIDLINKNP